MSVFSNIKNFSSPDAQGVRQQLRSMPDFETMLAEEPQDVVVKAPDSSKKRKVNTTSPVRIIVQPFTDDGSCVKKEFPRDEGLVQVGLTHDATKTIFYKHLEKMNTPKR